MGITLTASEAQIKKAVQDYLTAKRIFWIRLNAASFAGEYKGRKRYFQANSIGKGCPDLLAFLPVVHAGLRDPKWREILWIETKSQTGRASLDQQQFEWLARDRGEFYLLVRSVEEPEAWLKQRGL